jgi:hypothetical protein
VARRRGHEVRVAPAQVARAVEWAKEMEPGLRHLVVAGGVASNQYVRAQLAEAAASGGLELVLPPPRWCTDNGVMVAWAGAERLALGWAQPPPPSAAPSEGEWVDLRRGGRAGGSAPGARSSAWRRPAGPSCLALPAQTPQTRAPGAAG